MILHFSAVLIARQLGSALGQSLEDAACRRSLSLLFWASLASFPRSVPRPLYLASLTGFWNCIRISTKSSLISATRRKGTASWQRMAQRKPRHAATARVTDIVRRRHQFPPSGFGSNLAGVCDTAAQLRQTHHAISTQDQFAGSAQGSGTGSLGRRGRDWLDMAAKLAEVGGLHALGVFGAAPSGPKAGFALRSDPGISRRLSPRLLSSTRSPGQASERRPISRLAGRTTARGPRTVRIGFGTECRAGRLLGADPTVWFGFGFPCFSRLSHSFDDHANGILLKQCSTSQSCGRRPHWVPEDCKDGTPPGRVVLLLNRSCEPRRWPAPLAPPVLPVVVLSQSRTIDDFAAKTSGSAWRNLAPLSSLASGAAETLPASGMQGPEASTQSVSLPPALPRPPTAKTRRSPRPARASLDRY